MNQKSTHEWLPFYLRDHMAGAKSGINLFTRVARGHSNKEVRIEVARMRDDVAQDCQSLSEIMNNFGVREVSITTFMGVLAELVGRLKPNGALLKRSTGADVLELEALTAAVQAKARLWETLLALAESQSVLDAEQLRCLQVRAADQRNSLIALHGQLVRNLSTK